MFSWRPDTCTKNIKAVKPLKGAYWILSSFKNHTNCPDRWYFVEAIPRKQRWIPDLYQCWHWPLPEFICVLHALIRDGHDAFIINRRQLPSRFMNAEYPEIVKQKADHIPALDCLCFTGHAQIEAGQDLHWSTFFGRNSVLAEFICGQ